MKTALRSLYHHVAPTVMAIVLVGFFSGTPALATANADMLPPVSVIAQPRFTPDDFLVLLNAVRTSDGRQPLRLNDELDAAATAKAEDMAAKGYFDHFRPGDHKSPWAFIEEAGYDYRAAGENLAKGFRTPTGITTAWVNSPSHYANMISPKYTDVGFACIQTIDPDGQPVLLTVEMFGSR
ncbi:hypothetical protein KGQ71_00440 [Patescibacteria group bacterium]|nr:hypothetical protein [Patescibacteria group bacterium]